MLLSLGTKFLPAPTIPPVAISFIIPIGSVAIRVGIFPYLDAFVKLSGFDKEFVGEVLGFIYKDDRKALLRNLEKIVNLDSTSFINLVSEIYDKMFITQLAN